MSSCFPANTQPASDLNYFTAYSRLRLPPLRLHQGLAMPHFLHYLSTLHSSLGFPFTQDPSTLANLHFHRSPLRL